MSKRLSLKVITNLFLEKYPHGKITKLNNYTYEIMFDSRDTRTQTEHDMQDYYGIKTDTRKRYTYKANHLKELAERLKLDVSNLLDDINEYNTPEIETVKPENYDPDFFNKLFGNKAAV